jgi:FtsH-binding integral membrane protein
MIIGLIFALAGAVLVIVNLISLRSPDFSPFVSIIGVILLVFGIYWTKKNWKKKKIE